MARWALWPCILSSGRTASLHGDERFPLASVCKLPIAAHILAMVDEGRLSLDEEIDDPAVRRVAGCERGGRTMAEAAPLPARRTGGVDGREERQYGGANAVSDWRRAESHGRTPSPVAGRWDTPGSQRAPVYARRRGSAAGSTGVAVDARDVRQTDGGDPARGAPRRDARVPGRPPRHGHSGRHGSAAEESSSPANCSPRS